jgi:hypothetical protein
MYLATLSVAQDFIASNDWMMVNSELERAWKEAVVEYVKLQLHQLCGVEKHGKSQPA